MHDLATIQRMNREATQCAEAEAREERERKAAMQRHPAGSGRITEPAIDPAARTPEEIAKQTLGADALSGIGYERYLPCMVRAIKADRAQRATDLATLADAASKWATELTDYVIPNCHEATDDALHYEAERDEIQATLGRYLDEVEDPDEFSEHMTYPEMLAAAIRYDRAQRA